MKLRILSLLLAALLLCACGKTEQAAPEPPAPAPETLQPQSPAESEAEREARLLRKRVAAMSLEEKVGQLFFVRCEAAQMEQRIADYHLGGVLLFAPDYKDAAGNFLTEETFRAKLGSFQYAAAQDTAIPLFIGSDEEGGTVTRASRSPNLFSEKRKSPQSIYRAGGLAAIAEETFTFNSALLAHGVNVNFAPVADLSQNSADFIYARTLGESAETTARYVETAVAGMNQCRVGGELRPIGSVLKHFPGYGDNVDTHTGIAIDRRPYEQFAAEDFLPFRAGIDAGAGFVLVSHNIVECMDPTLPASLSPTVIRVLRQELGFDGVVLTDDLAMDAVEAYAADGSVAVLALLAGNDMILTTDYVPQIAQVLAAVESGVIDEARIDEACTRVLRTKINLGLLTLEE